MGFDCIWITPVVDSNGFMGYDAVNIFEIEPHFGSKDRDGDQFTSAVVSTSSPSDLVVRGVGHTMTYSQHHYTVQNNMYTYA